MNHLARVLRTTSLLSFLAVGGVVNAQVFTTTLSGLNESPVNNSAGTGTAIITLDALANTMRVQATFSGLTGNSAAAHIHAATAVAGTGTAGVATQTPTFTLFPTGVQSGTYDHLFDMTLASSYNAAYVTAHGGTTTQAQADLFAAIAAGKSYLNIHSTVFGGGEIRGFLVGAPVPEPGAMALLLGCGVAGIRLMRKPRSKK